MSDEESATRTYLIPEGIDGQRLDQAVGRMMGVSRTRAANVIDSGGVLVDGHFLPRSAHVVTGQILQVTLPEEKRNPPVVSGDLPILYADDDIIVVDKPVGVAAHASPGWQGRTVTAELAAQGYEIVDLGVPERQGIVHRLDVGTSGVMVVAKSARAYSALKRAFKQRQVTKTYHTVVQGYPSPAAGTIDAPIGRDPRHDHKFAVMAGGRHSITHYATLETLHSATLLEVNLETGRTHQIRVHMAAIKHPCCGDLTYGADPVLAQRLNLQRQWLHARELAFTHPGTGRPVSFVSEYSPDLQAALEQLR